MPNITPPPVPTRSQMADSQGLVSRPWLSWFTTLGQIFGFNQTIEGAGVAKPQQEALNFLPPFLVTNNPANGSTDVGLALAASTQANPPNGMGTNYQNLTGYDLFVSVVAYTGQGVGNNSAFALAIGPTAGGMVQTSVGNVTNGPGYATVSGLIPAGSFYGVNGIYGSLAIVAGGWTEMTR